MKHYKSLVVYNGKDKTVFRKDWELQNIPTEDFDAKKHIGKVFMHPDSGNGFIDADGMHVWQWCIPEDNDERDRLIEMGKWGVLKDLNSERPAEK